MQTVKRDMLMLRLKNILLPDLASRSPGYNKGYLQSEDYWSLPNGPTCAREQAVKKVATNFVDSYVPRKRS